MSGALDGFTLIVTRPASQAGRFMALASAAGATCLAYPVLRIERIALDVGTLARIRAQRWDWAIFSSANAVESALDQLPPPLAARHVAIGRATARELASRGVVVDVQPTNATSEGLLEQQEFSDLAGRSVLLIKGIGGRTLLRDVAVARGAVVSELEVYRRTPAIPAAAATSELHRALVDSRPVVVAVTSVQVLESLLNHVAADDAYRLRRRVLLVPGARVASAAARLGWKGPIVEAATAEDEAMVAALAQLTPGSIPPA